MALPFVPQELVDCIIEQAHDDTSVLARCSLVCSAWRPTSQRRLFYSLKIDLSQRPIADTIVFFSSSLNAESQGGHRAPITRYVHYLDIRSAGKHDELRKITTEHLSRIIGSLPHLKALTLEALRVRLDLGQLPCSSQRLERVSLKDVTVECGAGKQLVATLSTLCKLRALHLSNVSFGDRDEPGVHSAVDLKDIETLTLRTTRYMPLSLLPMFSRGALRNLDVACSSPDSVHALAAFLRTAGGRLEHFSLDLSRFLAKRVPATFEDDLRRISLGGCRALTALTLRITFLAEPWSNLPFNGIGLDAAAQVLATAPPGLRVLTLALALDGDTADVNAFLRPMAACFDTRLAWLQGLHDARPNLCELRWLWCYARKVGNPKAWPVSPKLRSSLSKLVWKGLLELCMKGILMFVDGDEDIWG